ncbi:MAG: hypothetical protein L0L93_09955, partial [Brevibacterium sp.]|nr:hypothetical protein [Brevibacterium sp.]
EDLDAEDSATDQTSEPAESALQEYAASSSPEQSAAEPADPVPSAVDDDAPSEESDDVRAATSRARRMPIVQPPSSSGVRVVTAASAQIPEVDSPETTTDADSSESSRDGVDSRVAQGEETAATGGSPGSDTSADQADSADGSDSADGTAAAAETGSSSDDAARALAANPETRPMEAVPEAWALPNPDYEDEETENPPGARVRASAVTGHDGRILVGEEPSKVPYVVLGVAALFAVALIVIALVMLL